MHSRALPPLGGMVAASAPELDSAHSASTSTPVPTSSLVAGGGRVPVRHDIALFRVMRRPGADRNRGRVAESLQATSGVHMWRQCSTPPVVE